MDRASFAPRALVVALLSFGAAALVFGQTTGGGGTTTTTPQVPIRQTMPAISNADSNGTMIAVTGIDLTGSSILYLVDTERRQLAVYQASGGTDSMQGIKLVGARKIDLDLQLEGFNDKSEYSFEELQKRFDENARGAAGARK